MNSPMDLTTLLAKSACDTEVPEATTLELTSGFAQGLIFCRAFPEYAMALCNGYDHELEPRFQLMRDWIRDSQIQRWKELIEQHPITINQEVH